jgi:4-amino-4-deoxy-L-arabinose transferase-like glycosyltransferase
MIGDWKERKPLAGAAVFALAFLYLYWIAGDVLRMAGDEGIYLEGGRRIALGQQPYRDFFVLTGPLTFWIEGALARCSGMSLAVMRLSAILDAAFLAWVVYWLTSRYASALYSAGTAFVFLAYAAHTRQLNVNHRWDSAALAMAAIAAAWAAQRTGRRGWWVASGFLVAAAGCATPAVLVVALPLLCWCWWWRRAAGLAAFLGGGAVVTATGALYLQWNGALLPMIQSMRWTSAHYTAANSVLYGNILMDRAAGAQSWATYLPAALYALVPAILPVAALAGWLWYLRRRENRAMAAEIPWLLAAAAALVLSAWPRWTSSALLHTLALSWFLCALLFHRLTAPRQRYWLSAALLLAAAASVAGKSMAALDYWPRETRVGTLRAPADESEFLGALERRIQAGDSLFSYPYMPSAYYFLNARNPTRYSFLQPGMMTREDEWLAVAELEAAPPHWVIYEDFPPAAVLAIWPGSDPALIPMEIVNGYLRENYRPAETVTGPWGKVMVMERMAARR